MQRAAASAAVKEAHASASEDSLPSIPKRPRLSEQNSPATPRTSDLEAISAALAAEEEKRREAIARQAAEAGESEWVLDIPPATNGNAPQPLVVAADSLDADGDVGAGGRRAYGNFKRKPRTVSIYAWIVEHLLICSRVIFLRPRANQTIRKEQRDRKSRTQQTLPESRNLSIMNPPRQRKRKKRRCYPREST